MSHPSPAFIGQANMVDPGIYERFGLDNFPECFKEYAELLTWERYWHTTLDTSEAPSWKWFVGGRLNACFNCVDRHLDQYRNKAAIVFVPEPEDEATQAITFQELYVRVNELAAYLRDCAGLKQGDRVTLHMPMVPELPITMLACARLGVIHSEVFGGFSGRACGDRIADSGSRVLITSDGYHRGGQLLDHKVKADEAVAVAEEAGQTVDKVLVWRRYPGRTVSETPMVEGRDHFVDEGLKHYAGQAGRSGGDGGRGPALHHVHLRAPRANQRAASTRRAAIWLTSPGPRKFVQDIHPTDVYWCMADIGWITGHSYIVYGPLSLAATGVIYEGVPTYPDAGRAWRIAERLGVNIFHTAPTTVRMLRKAGPDEPAKYDYHFKHMTTVGEPIEPEVWRWYYEAVGKGEAAIVDTWWQTETGGFLCTTMPGLHPMKPGSAGPAAPGIHPVIYDENGAEVPAGSGVAGNICIRNPWPGGFQTIWGDHERFVENLLRQVLQGPPEYRLARLALLRGRWRDASRGRVLPHPRPRRRRDQHRRPIGWAPRSSNPRRSPWTRWPRPRWCRWSTRSRAARPTSTSRSNRDRARPAPRAGWSRRSSATSARSHAPSTSTSCPTCPRRARARSCAGCWRRSRTPWTWGDVTTLANPDVVEEVRVLVQGKEKVGAERGPRRPQTLRRGKLARSQKSEVRSQGSEIRKPHPAESGDDSIGRQYIVSARLILDP